MELELNWDGIKSALIPNLSKDAVVVDPMAQILVFASDRESHP